MTSLEGCIRYWNSKYDEIRNWLSPSEEAQIKLTILFLKELQKLKAGEQ